MADDDDAQPYEAGGSITAQLRYLSDGTDVSIHGVPAPGLQ